MLTASGLFAHPRPGACRRRETTKRPRVSVASLEDFAQRLREVEALESYASWQQSVFIGFRVRILRGAEAGVSDLCSEKSNGIGVLHRFLVDCATLGQKASRLI